MEQVIQTEPTRNHKHQALVKLRRNIKKNFVVVLQLQTIVLHVIYHSSLLLVEKLPNF